MFDRFEGLDLARERDSRALSAWRLHPYLDIVDNRSDFDAKLRRLVDLVVRRVGRVDVHFEPDSRKVKFALKPEAAGGLLLGGQFPVAHSDFEVVHHYLKTGSRGIQTRLRKRGHGGGRWTYSCTVRKPERSGQTIEVQTVILYHDNVEQLLHASLH